MKMYGELEELYSCLAGGFTVMITIAMLIFICKMSKKEKHLFEITLSNGKMIKDSLINQENSFENDKVTYYKKFIIKAEIK